MYQGRHSGVKHRISPILTILLILFVGIFCFSGYKVASELIQARNENNAFLELAAIKRHAQSENNSQSPKETIDASGMQREEEPVNIEHEVQDYSSEPLVDPENSTEELLPEYQPIYELNPDYFGWLSIEGTAFDYPVVFTPEEPEHYLHLAFDGTYSNSGVPFLDGNWSGNENYFLIYGHNMKNGTMFGQLLPYMNAAYQKEHPVIQFDTLHERHEYEVMAVFLSKVYYLDEEYQNAFRYYEYYDLADEYTFKEYIRLVKQSALYDTGVDAEFGDAILVLSTCNYHTEDGRFVVVARERKVE